MVRQIFSFFYKETSKLHQAAFLLAFFSTLSLILGVVRDRALAYYFGASLDLDIYYASFRIPDLIFVTIASIVSLSVIVPFIIEREKIGKESVKNLVDDIFSFFSITIVVVCLLAFILMPTLSGVLFKGFSPESLEKVVFTSRLLLLSPIFLGLSNLFGSITQAYNRFLIYAFAPVLYNGGIIFGIFFLVKSLGVVGVALGVVLGSILHVAIQIPFIKRLGFVPRFKLLFDFNEIKRVVFLSLPRTFALSMTNIASIFLISLASLMVAGSISVFSFAQNISTVPLSVIGVSYSLAAFPTFSRHFLDNNFKAFLDHVSLTLRHIIFWSMPVIALFVVLRAQIVRVLLGSGSFDWSDTRLTAAALALFSISALSQSLILLFVRGFYSAGHTKKPLFISILSNIILILLTYTAVKLYYSTTSLGPFVSSLLKVSDLSGTVVLMLPLGFSIGTIISSIMFWISFERSFGKFPKETYKTLFHSFSSAIFVGLGSYIGLNLFASMFDLQTLVGIFFQGLFAGILGIGLGILVLWMLKSEELREFWKVIHQKFQNVDVVAENQEIV